MELVLLISTFILVPASDDLAKSEISDALLLLYVKYMAPLKREKNVNQTSLLQTYPYPYIQISLTGEDSKQLRICQINW